MERMSILQKQAVIGISHHSLSVITYTTGAICMFLFWVAGRIEVYILYGVTFF